MSLDTTTVLDLGTPAAPAGLIALARSRWEMALALLSRLGGPGSAKRDAMAVFGVRVASAGLLYLSQVVLARLMGSTQYGIYVSIWTVVLVLGGMAPLGMGQALVRLLPTYRERGDGDLLRGALWGSRWLALASGLATSLLAFAIVWMIGGRIDPAYRLPAYIGIACLPWFALSDVQDGLGRAQGWMMAGLVPPYLLRPALIVGGVLVQYWAGLPMDAVAATVAAVVACWVTALVQGVVIQRRIDASVPDGPIKFAYRGWMLSSLPLLSVSTSELVLQNADVLVLSAYLPPSAIAMYFAAGKTMALVMFVHYAVGSVVAKDFAALNARGDEQAMKRYARDAVRWTFFPSVAAAIGILVIGKPLLWMFSPRFVEAYPVMVVLVAGFLVRAAVGPTEFVLNALGAQRACGWIAAAAAMADIVLALILVPRFGLIGGAVATALAMAGAALSYSWLAKARFGLDFAAWRLLSR